MTISTAAAWLTDHWYVTLAALVLVLAPVLGARAWRRGSRPDLAQHGARIEDWMTLAVASAAAYLSSTGLRAFGADVMHLGRWESWLPFISLDIAALVCARRARRRAAGAESAGLSGSLVWVFIAISAAFSAQEADTLGGVLARMVWPVIAGVLYEIGTLEKRRTARKAKKEAEGTWVDRRLSAVRLLHPVEWVRVRMELAADETLSQEEATRRVRVARAGLHLYKLFGALDGWAVRARWHDMRAQRAQGRVPVQDLRLAVQEARRRTRTRDMARLSQRRAGAADAALETIVSRTDTRTAADDDRTEAADTAPSACTGGRDCPCQDCTDDALPQVSAGADVTDEELIDILRGKLTEDGAKFTTGGQRRTARALGIGTGRATRVMDAARTAGPLPTQDQTPVHHQDAVHHQDDHAPGLAA
ncbi:hypothetical protein [Streptomyces sp. NPDC007063]|uniref:hypothetical protein n=1 Tax=Streptomyces sp. NPDC007063 TaxID=3364772 RepID=UPI0036A4F5C9